MLKLSSPDPTAPDPIPAFLKQLSKCAGHNVKRDAGGSVVWDGSPPADLGTGNNPFADALNDLITNAHTLTLKLRTGTKAGEAPPEEFVDDFCQRTVFVDQVNEFPEDPPSEHLGAATRCELLIHFLAEYGAALQDGGREECTDGGFARFHKAGVEAQTKYRHVKGQPGIAHGNFRVDDHYELQHCDGTRTRVTVGADGKIHVREEPTPDKERKYKTIRQDARTLKRMFDDAEYVFIGVVDSVGPPPGVWSSFALAYQRVTYLPEAFLSRSLDGPYVDVHHLVVQYSALSAAERPGLSPQIFVPGQRLLVFATLEPDPEARGHFRLESQECDLAFYVGTRAQPSPIRLGERSLGLEELP